MKKVVLLMLLFTSFIQVYSQSKFFTVGATFGSPVRTNSLTFTMNEDYMNTAKGKERHYSLNVGGFIQFAAPFLNKKGNRNNLLEFRYGITNRLYDWKHDETLTLWDNEIYHYKHFNLYKQQNYNLSVGVKHIEQFKKIGIALGVDIQYINYQQVNHKIGFNYWDEEGNWLGYRNIEGIYPGGYSLGLNANIGLNYTLAHSFSVGCQLNFGAYRTHISGPKTYHQIHHYWDSWSWVTKIIAQDVTMERVLINTSPIIPEIRIAWHFNHKSNLCRQPVSSREN